MKKTLTGAAALLATTTIASAGGLDRSGQSIAPLFEKGGYIELSYGSIHPNASGSLAGGAIKSGDILDSYGQFGAAIKWDVNEQISAAVIFDQPFGADVSYTNTSTPGYPLTGTTAELNATAVTALLRYKMNDRFSVHGGLRMMNIDSKVDIKLPTQNGVVPYTGSMETDTGVGYVLGVAYEIPEIALRAALTYSSAIEFDATNEALLAGTPVAGPDNFSMPQSVNLDFQTGIAADTLLLAGIRWVDWSETELNPTAYPNNPIIDYDRDSVTYSLGVGRRFTDQFSGRAMITYEAASGDKTDNLAPVDGSLALSLAGAYAVNENVTISGGVRFVRLGDATTEILGQEYEDNFARAIGLQVSYSF